MLKKILLALIFVITAITNVTHAEDDMKTVASKAYVDTQIEMKQLKIPAAGQPNVGAGETVMTYTSNGNGEIGERGLYSDISSYDANTDGDKLITASALNATFTNLPTTPTTKLECANSPACTLWTIVDQTAYDILPAGYTRLEYIQSTGTQYIDTGILLSNTDVFEISFQSLNSLETPIMGAISGGTSYTSTGNLSVTYTVLSGLSAYSVYCDGAAGNSNYSWNGGNRADGLKHTIKYNGLNIAPTLDGVSMTQVGTHTLTENTPTVTTWLFGRNNTSTGTLSQNGIRIYNVNIQGKGHFIPAKRNSDDVIGMYDTVTGTFFTNAATSGPDFTAGPPAD